MSVCLRRPLHSTLLFSSSSSSSYTTATRTSTISPKRLGRVWSRRSLSHVSATATASTTTLRLFKLPTPPGFFFLFNLQTLFHQPLLIFLYVMLLFICLELYVYIFVYSSKSGENSGSNYLCLNSKLFIQLSLIF